MSTSHELRTKAIKLCVDAQADLNSADLTPEVEARATAQFDEAAKLEARADKLEAMKEMESRMNAVDLSKRPIGETGAIKATGETRTAMTKFMDYVRMGVISTDFEVRSGQTEGTSSAGGYTVPIEFYDQVTTSVINYSPLGNPDVTTVLETTGGNPMQFPTLNDTASFGEIIGEANAANTANAFTFGQKTLSAYTFINDIVQVSIELLNDTGVTLEALLADQIGQRIARKEGQKWTLGSGTGEPTGLVTALSAANATTSSANSGVIVFDDIINLQYAVNDAYWSRPRAAFHMNQSTMGVVRRLKDNYGRYLIDYQQLANAKQPLSLLGFPVVINNAMANVGAGNMPIIFGDGGCFYVRKVGGIQIQRLVERYVEYRQVGFASWTRGDSNLLDPLGLRGLSN